MWNPANEGPPIPAENQIGVNIVDSQVHVWAVATPERPWSTGQHRAHRPVPFSRDDLLREMDAARVHRAVIVPPWWAGEYNDVGLEAARLHPDRFAVMGLLDLVAPSARERLATWRRQSGMLGLRFSSQHPKYQSALAERYIDWLWPAAEEAGVPIMLSVSPDQLCLVDHIAARHSGLKLIIDHLARDFGKKDAEAFAKMDQLLVLAKRPNIAVKASGMPAYASDGYPYRSVHPYIRRAYDAFGPKRMFWGSDFTKLPCTYQKATTMFTEELEWLTGEDKEWIMGRGLCEWLGWKL